VSPRNSIVILAPAYPLRGGIASSSERLAFEFIAQGHEVTIYTFSLQYPGFLFPGKTQYSEDPPPRGLTIKVKVNSINPFNWWKVGKELRALRPDIIIARYWLPFMAPALGTILRQAKKNKHSKVVAIVDNIIPHEKRPGDVTLSKYFVGAVDAFIVMSKSVGNELRQFTSDKAISYVPHPIYDNYGDPISKAAACTRLQLSPDGKYLLFFGFIRAYKGLDLLIKAMADPRIRQQNIHLIIAGEYYSDKETYEALFDKEGVKDLLILKTDFIPNPEVPWYFCAADLVVQPYKSATQSGISQLAYHFEKPMVATRVGGLPEIISDKVSGYMVEIEPTAIADAIIDFYEHNRAAKMTEAVVREKARFSWGRMVEEILGIASSKK
jgi:glycosyltransferase involved in cell wall biosynthesis